MGLRRAAGFAAAAALLSLLPTTSATAVGAVQLGRIQYSPPGPDLPVTDARLNGEYVAIRNSGRSSVTLTGWTLRDTTGRPDHVYRFGPFALRAGATVVVHSGRGTNGPAHLYWGRAATSRFAYVWSNTGDTVYLRDAGGRLEDSCAWPAGAGTFTC